MDCPHIPQISKKAVEKKIVTSSTPLALKLCHSCGVSVESKWMCLMCGDINCGRYSCSSMNRRFVKGHALLHFTETKHPISIDLDSFACHWYRTPSTWHDNSYLCDDYVYSSDDLPLEDVRSMIKKCVGERASMSPSSQVKKGRKRGYPGKKFEHLTGLSNLGTFALV